MDPRLKPIYPICSTMYLTQVYDVVRLIRLFDWMANPWVFGEIGIT